MDRVIMQAISGEIMSNETILWTGRPNLSIHLNKSDIFLIPFSIFWFGFAIFWIMGASHAAGAFGLFGIPFVLVGFYITFGRFVLKARKKSRTGYAITNIRVLAVTLNANGDRKSLASADIKKIQNDSLLPGKQKTGSILFGAIPFYSSIYLNSGMDMFINSQLNSIMAFFDIDDAEQVYDIYKRAQYSNEQSS